MNKAGQLVCAHSAWVVAILMGLGIFVIAGWMPLIEPGMSSADLAAHFEQNRMRIRLGMSVLALAVVFWWPFSAAIAMQMKRVEGESHPFTYVQMGAASGSAITLLLAAYCWLVAAYRPETPPSTIQMLNDFSWFMFVSAYPPIFIQSIAIGFCILMDSNPVKAYPRWVGFAAIWSAILFVPGALVPFFFSGPFAWNGLIAFWLVATIFFGWIFVMWWNTVKAIKSDPRLN